MPYDVAVVRPESDAPIKKTDNWMQWYSWAKKNQPSVSVLTAELRDFLTHLLKSNNHPALQEAAYCISMGECEIPPAMAERIVDNAAVRPPEPMYRVLKFAALNGYPVRFSATAGDAINDH